MEYTKNQLKTLHKILTSMLKEIDDFCSDNGIRYFLMYGSLIGAVRHNGFIPWDDDIDIGMLREDYDKFMLLAQKKFKDNLLVENYNNCEGYGHVFGKIVLKGTIFEEYFTENVDCMKGVYIDVFPIDMTTNNKLLRKKQWLIGKILARMILLNRKYNYRKKGTKKVLYCFGYKFSGIFAKQWLVSRWEKNAKKYNGSSSNTIIVLPGIYSLSKETFNIDLFSEEEYHKFEEIKVKIPKRYHEILSNNYGDYMKLPPKSQQVAHHNIKRMDFGSYGGK